ncbi:hypothetical protein [Roseomonas sp. BN140053]
MLRDDGLQERAEAAGPDWPHHPLGFPHALDRDRRPDPALPLVHRVASG